MRIQWYFIQNNKTMFRFKEENSLSKRIVESQKAIAKWPGRVPIILEKSPNSRLDDLAKNKLLCPSEYNIQQFVGSIRKKVNLPRDTALFIFVNGTELVSGEVSMNAIYEEKKDPDGFLYIMFSEQEVMG